MDEIKKVCPVCVENEGGTSGEKAKKLEGCVEEICEIHKKEWKTRTTSNSI